MHRKLTRPIVRTLGAAALALATLMLPGCGGGDEEPPPAIAGEVVSGSVAAGSYLANAVVFLDLNDNNVLDSNERRTTTDAKGSYRLAGLNATDVARHAIVVRVLPETTNVDTGQPAGLDCTMKAAPSQGAFVSPFSTLASGLVNAAASPSLAAAATRMADKTRASTLPLAAPGQLDLLRDYVADSASTTPGTAADGRQLRRLATALAGILSAVTTGLNRRQSIFDANGRTPYDTLVTLAEGQLTLVANGTYQFSQLDAVQRARLIDTPASSPNFFVNGNAMLDAFIANIRLADVLPEVKNFIVNSDEFKQFFASVMLDLASQVAELLLKLLI